MPVPEAQVSDLPAVAPAEPATALMVVMSDGAKESVHCKPAGSFPAGEVRDKFREMVPAGATIPESRINASDCAQAGLPRMRPNPTDQTAAVRNSRGTFDLGDSDPLFTSTSTLKKIDVSISTD